MKAKRALGLLLALTLLSGLLLFPAQAAEGQSNFSRVNSYRAGQFADVAAGSWYAGSVKDVWEYGLMRGESDTSFSPEGKLRCAEAVALAARLHSIYHGSGDAFSQGSPWYQVYVDYAKANGILTVSFSDYTAPITRRDFARLIYAAFPAPALPAVNTVDDGMIPDVPMSASYAPQVYALYRAGILTGNDAAGTFTPEANITRGAVAAIVSRMADVSLRRSITLREPTTVLYSVDGRVAEVKNSQVDTYTALGWYKTPQKLRYTDSGRQSGLRWDYGSGYLCVTDPGGSGTDVHMNDASTLYLRRGSTSAGLLSYYGRDKLRRVELADTVTGIGSHAFEGCAISRVGIPSSVTSIASDAFYSSWDKSGGGNENMLIYCEAGSAAELYAISRRIDYVYATQVFYPDGRTCMVSAAERGVYLANGWYSFPVATLYADDGRTKVVSADQVAANVAVGWYEHEEDAYATLYSVDGRSKEVLKSRVAAEQAVGWYLYPDYVCARADYILNTEGFSQAIAFLETEMRAVSSSGKEYGQYAAKRSSLCALWMKTIGCPVAIESYSVSYNSFGEPRAYFTFRNLSAKVITRLDLTFVCYDARGRVTTDDPSRYNGSYDGWMTGISLAPGAQATYYWTLSTNRQTASVRNYHMTAVSYSDGSSWHN